MPLIDEEPPSTLPRGQCSLRPASPHHLSSWRAPVHRFSATRLQCVPRFVLRPLIILRPLKRGGRHVSSAQTDRLPACSLATHFSLSQQPCEGLTQNAFWNADGILERRMYSRTQNALCVLRAARTPSRAGGERA